MRDHFNYKDMVDRALRGVVRAALKQVQKDGMRGNHHMYISFNTLHDGVVIPDYLRQKYAKEMTIVMQHQFWDLDVQEDGFDLTLSFNSVPERLTVPFAALTGFADPSVQFGLQFQGEKSGDKAGEKSDKPARGETTASGLPATRRDALPALATVPPTPLTPASAKAAAPAPPPAPEAGNAEKVVALDKFRKK